MDSILRHIVIYDTGGTVTNTTGVITAPAVTYATWNPADKDTALTLSGGDLVVTHTTGVTIDCVRATIGKLSGKWYWELTMSVGPVNQNQTMGVADLMTALGGFDHVLGNMANSVSLQTAGNIRTNGGGPTKDFLGTPSDGEVGNVWGFALDMDNGRIYIHKNGVYENSGDPVAGTGFLAHDISGTYYPAISLWADVMAVTANFGATAFAHSVPTGYTAGITA